MVLATLYNPSNMKNLPCGEPYINQRTSDYSERFTFTGKGPRKGWRTPLSKVKYREQRDKEKERSRGPFASERGDEPRSGIPYCSVYSYTYFGARYMDHELMTMWLSVDPMSDKYPSISPYAYCAWNPVKLVDPDGKEFTVWIEDGEGNTYEYKPNMAPTGDAAAQQQIQTLNKMYSTSLGQEVLDVLIESGNDYYITNESTRTPGTSGTVEYGNGAKCKMGGNNTLLGISHELFHAFQYENCQGGATYKNEVEAYLYSNALVMEAGVPSIYQLGTLNPGTPDGDKFEKAMENLSGTSFSQTDFSTAVDLFQSQSRMNSAGTYNASYYTKGDPSNGSLLQQFYPLER